MAPPFSLGAFPTKPLTLLPAGIFLVNDDPTEVVDVRSGRPCDQQIAESVKKSLRIIIFQEIGAIEAQRPGARDQVASANAPEGSLAAPLPPPAVESVLSN